MILTLRSRQRRTLNLHLDDDRRRTSRRSCGSLLPHQSPQLRHESAAQRRLGGWASRRPAVPSLPALALALALLAAGPAARADALNRIVLRVNDQIATLYDYQVRRSEAVREIIRREQDPSERQKMLAQVGEIIFRDMFQELLLNSRADQLGIEVSEQEVDTAIAQMRDNAGLKSDEAFAQALAESSLTLAQLKAQTRRNQRLHTVLGKEIQSKVKVKEEDLRRYYGKHLDEFRQPEQVQLREVVVLDAGGRSDEERARIAAEIRQAVGAGKSLADAAAGYAAKGITSNVVELGWMSPKDLDPNLETAAWKLEKGTLSEPVRARGGLHLLQVIDRREARTKPFAEVSAQIQTQESERVYREESTKYMAELERKSLVVADPPQEAAGFRRKLGDTSEEPLGLAGTGAAGPAGAAADAKANPAADAKPAAGEGPSHKPSILPNPKPIESTPPPSPPPPGKP
ncbi:MAG TPA: peptidyl-prolyl cis-trans isomerase [Thermoanaerobaculia bacterium]|nr:peptidyl-prolyl cis-trans isomerase [Thermoanaerobaculia bacterium]